MTGVRRALRSAFPAVAHGRGDLGSLGERREIGPGSEAGQSDGGCRHGRYQVFISPARNLVGGAVVISVEPVPDNSPAPFAIKPLVDMMVKDVGPGQLQGMANNAGSNPSGLAVWR